MIFTTISLSGAYLIDLEKRDDERGFFARLFCQREFSNHGLEAGFVQINNSLNVSKGTLRGMHYQLAPASDVKVVRCISGALYDVILDLRPDSVTFGQWFSAELTAENRKMMYVPRGFAHGFITLTDNTEVLYLASEFYCPKRERGIRWNDPRFGITWPLEPTTLANRDRLQPDFDPATHLA